MAEVKFQPSQKVESFFSDDLANDSERFLLFLKAYYEWLQTTKITYTSLSGTFQRDETLTGTTSGATATIKEVATGYIVVLVTSRVPFEIGETITGSTSSATAIVSTIKENVVRASGNLLNNRYIETTIDQYQDYLKSELYDSIPKEFLGDKRTVALKFKKYFESKSNEESYRFLFRLLYNEPIEFYYPGEDILRPSDGKFEKTNILRAAYNINIFNFLEKTIRGQTSGALANVIDVKSFFVGGIEIAEFTLKLVSGTFSAGETIESIDNGELTTIVYGIVADFTINDGGSGYSVGDSVTITGDGSEAQARVSSISDAPISSLKVNTIGHGYRLNTEATINESGTGGSGLLVRVTELANTYSYTDANTSTTYTLGEVSRVQILNRGSGYISAPTITLQDTTIASLGLLSAELITIEDGGSDYGVGNTLVFTGGSGANAAGQVASVEESTTYDLLFEDDFRMLSEDSYYDIIKNEDWEVLGAITRVELTNFGDGYETANLPSITVTTTTGSGANLIATDIQGNSANVEVDIANNTVGIGAIRSIEVTDFGVDYSTATADATGIGDGNANLSIIISGLGIKDGNWINDDGKLNYKYIQDSFFYQDFSYVIKSGLAFNFYKDVIKGVIHPAGLQPFGEILISNTLDVSARILSSAVTSEIQQYLIYIESFFNVGVEYVDTIIRSFREVQIEKEFDISTDLLSQKQYTLNLPSITLNSDYDLFSKYEIEIVLSGDNVPNVSSEIISSVTAGQVVTYISEFRAYGITYGDFKFINTGIYDIDWSEQQIQVLANNTFEQAFDDGPATKSGFTLFNKSSFDILSDFESTSYKMRIEKFVDDQIEIDSSMISKIETLTINDTLGGFSRTNKYKQIQGTVSSDLNTEYKDLNIDNVANTQITKVSTKTFETSVPQIIGSNTIFLVDYSIGDVIVANNEYFEIISVSSNTALIIDRPPENAFTNISAYKAI